MDFIEKYLGKDDPVTEDIVRELHKITVKGVRGEKKGTFYVLSAKVAGKIRDNMGHC